MSPSTIFGKLLKNKSNQYLGLSAFLHTPHTHTRASTLCLSVVCRVSVSLSLSLLLWVELHAQFHVSLTLYLILLKYVVNDLRLPDEENPRLSIVLIFFIKLQFL